MEVKWIKITTDVFDNDKIMLLETMPEGDTLIVIWFKILALAGKQNCDGYLMMNDKIAYTEEMLATIFRRPLQILRLALSTFERFGMVEIVDNAILISNWEKYQSADKLKRMKESNRIRQARYREKKKKELELSDSNVTLTLPVTLHNATDIDIDKDIEIEEGEEEERKIQLAVQTYREMFGINSYLEQQNLIYDIEDASVDVYLEALKEATNQKAETPAYIRKVLRNWKSRGLDTVEKIENARIAFNTKKQNQKIPPKSNVPDWSNVNNPDYVEETLSPEEQEKAKQEMLERLNKLKKKEE
ncbi:phage replisome organizer N-terminal domain-containing protein [Streptococcus uberis]|uniref:phage replisome organizer N-terminal domain-containing protein n=1 Tax=Streptococcus uberis TaxID=1349 RepID=UPI001FF184D4|nr:phage replisome organizer N-terminal domain-containing protein [Streptococcus uberis]MCK1225996.1 phage replisome organizer N-terminal domain-containing protein [Streptococcus uberis]